MKKILTLLCSLVLFAACNMQKTPDSSGNTNTSEALKIGYIGPLTGDTASLGNADKNAVEMYFAKHPLLLGRPVEVVYEDAHCNGEASASAAEKLITQDKVQVIFGGTCSGETLAAAPATEKNKVILFSSVSTSPEITTAGDYLFRNVPSDEKATDVLVAELSTKYTKIAIISQNNDFAQAYRQKLKEKFLKAGGEVVLDEAFNTGTTDFKTVLQKVKNSGAETLINFAGESAPAGIINRQATELGLSLPIYGNDVMMGAEFFEIAKNAAEGSIIVATAAESGAENDPLIQEYVTRYGEEPPSLAYVFLSYDRAAIIAQAISKVGYDGTKIKDWLYEMQPYEGVAGTTVFDHNGDSSILPKLLIAKNGKFEIVK